MKKGFTLIELLAVIIILAIVALIATPLILNVINDARNSAAKSEAQLIAGGVEKGCLTNEVATTPDASLTTACNGTQTLDAAAFKTVFGGVVNFADVEMSGSVTITNGAVTTGTVNKDGICTQISNGIALDPSACS